jgi:hypothetical protein
LESDLIDRLDDLGDVIAGRFDAQHRLRHGLHIRGAGIRGGARGGAKFLGDALALLAVRLVMLVISSREALVSSSEAAD